LEDDLISLGINKRRPDENKKAKEKFKKQADA
jgi:hypothetical protein